MQSPNRALLIREPWISLILNHKKDWEMRSRPTTIRGPICLVRAGSGTVVGVARIVDSLPALPPDEYMDHVRHHAVPERQLSAVLERNWVYPWVLGEVRRLERPVPYRHRGGVTFTTLEPQVVRVIAEQLREYVAGPEETDTEINDYTHTHDAVPQSIVESTGTKFQQHASLPVSPTFTFRPEKAQAFGIVMPDGRFLVQAGSTAMRNGSPEVKRDRMIRDGLVQQGVLVPDADPELLRFAVDHRFTSASQAAGVVKDGNASGPSLWKDENTGRTLQEFLSSIRE